MVGFGEAAAEEGRSSPETLSQPQAPLTPTAFLFQPQSWEQKPPGAEARPRAPTHSCPETLPSPAPRHPGQSEGERRLSPAPRPQVARCQPS